MTRTITNRVPPDRKKQGMTVRDLGLFLQDVHNADIDLDTPVKVRNGLRSQILELEVTG